MRKIAPFEMTLPILTYLLTCTDDLVKQQAYTMAVAIALFGVRNIASH